MTGFVTHQRRHAFSVVLGFFLLCLWGVSQIFAQGILEGETGQTNPKDRPNQVTAIVPPQGAPPPPGLITPKDGAILTSGVVTFQWTQVEHLAAIERYELYINGTLKFGSIHNSNQNTDDYVLTIENGIYTLTLKQDKWLPDGNYTWKVRVIDSNNRGMDSTTWRFVVDSTPPNILITKIDGQTTAISAADPTTIPTDPVETKRRSPLIEGHTEASSEVQLTVTFADGSLKRYKTTAHLDGRFSFQLEPLPVRQAVTLTFTAIDLAGNSRVLDGLKLIYKPRVITIPLPPILPNQPILEISVVIPAFPQLPPLTDKNFPPPFGPLIGREEPEVPQDTKVIEVPVFDADPWLWGWVFLFAGYVIAVFLATRNPWWSFGSYFLAMIRFWIMGLGKQQTRWTDEHGTVLPFYAFLLTWIDERHKFHEQTWVSTPAGRWQVPLQAGHFFSLKNAHARLVYPAPTLKFRVAEGETLLAGQSWSMVPEGALELREETFLIPQNTPVTFVAAAHHVASRVRGWGLWVSVPRIILAIELLLTIYLLWFVKTWLTITFLVLVIVMIARDLQASLRERLRVYGEEP